MMHFRLLQKHQPNRISTLTCVGRYLLFLVLIFARVDCVADGHTVHGSFLPDLAAKKFWENFLSERFLEDYVASIQVETRVAGKSETYDGVILHKAGKFIVEFADHDSGLRKFLVTRDKSWSNIDDHLNFQCVFIPNIKYGPNDLLLPIVCTDSPKYCGPKNVCGRMTQQFIVEIPADRPSDGMKFIRFSIDGAFHQPLQIEYLDDHKRLVRYQKLARLKKCGSDWVPKTFELVDVCTRKKIKITMLKFDVYSNLDANFFSEDFLKDHTFIH